MKVPVLLSRLVLNKLTKQTPKIENLQMAEEKLKYSIDGS
jgi:hypothetical protein